MGYVTVDLMKTILGQIASATSPGLLDQLSDREPPFQVFDSDVVQTLIDETAAHINTYLVKQYTLPVTNTDDLLVLRQVNRWLATWELWNSHPEVVEVPKNVAEQYRQARDWLLSIADKTTGLPSTTTESRVRGGAWVQQFTEASTANM